MSLCHTLLLYSVFMLFLSRRGSGNTRGQFSVTSAVPQVLFAPFLSPIACVCSENPHQDQWQRWSFPLRGAEMTTVNGIAVAHVRYDKLALPCLCWVGSPYVMFYAHYYVFFSVISLLLFWIFALIMSMDTGGRGPRDWQLYDVFRLNSNSDWSDEAKNV